MIHELLVWAMFFIISLAVYEIHRHYTLHAAKRAAAKADADTLNAISPLHADAQPGKYHAHKRHAYAIVAATVAHPATAESIHHYVVHFLVYSGVIIK
jgi:hypothetical protein